MCPHVSAANHPYLKAVDVNAVDESDRTTWQHCSRPVPKSPEPRPSLPDNNFNVINADLLELPGHDNMDNVEYQTDSEVEDPDYETNPRQWSAHNWIEMKDIPFTRQEGFLVPLPDIKSPISFIILLVDIVALEGINYFFFFLIFL
ncbi:hypothetical protein J6590_024845 [Homalodisca vitripennis]|nr:hypothetical protein J6590_024845 [Homalodisca vitripennis]